MTYCPRDCDNTKCRRNIKSNPLECNFSYYGDFNLCGAFRKDEKMLFDEYKRNYLNFDKCMEAFEKILIICKEQNNIEIAKVIEDTLDKLEVKENCK